MKSAKIIALFTGFPLALVLPHLAQTAYAAPSPVYNLQYAGFAEDVANTAPLTAQAAISANVTYHFKIAIADTPVDDYLLDSAVFIKPQTSPIQ